MFSTVCTLQNGDALEPCSVGRVAREGLEGLKLVATVCSGAVLARFTNHGLKRHQIKLQLCSHAEFFMICGQCGKERNGSGPLQAWAERTEPGSTGADQCT